jgi:hypothetical protein
MRTFLSLVLLSALIGCAKSDARPAKTVERAPEMEGLSMPTDYRASPRHKVDIGEQKEQPKEKKLPKQKKQGTMSHYTTLGPGPD